MKNEGKKFEEDFKKSVPSELYYYRFRDGTAAWDGGEARFQQMNVCDCLIYDNLDSQLYMFELKSHKGKSIPITVFRSNQLEGLTEAYEHGVVAGALINMRDVEQTYYLNVKAVTEFIAAGERKSIPIAYMIERGCLIKSDRKRVRFSYDIYDMLKQIRAGK